MQLTELADLIADAVAKRADDLFADVVEVEIITSPENPDRNLLRLNYGNGGSTVLIAAEVTGPDVPRHAPYEIPAGVL